MINSNQEQKGSGGPFHGRLRVRCEPEKNIWKEKGGIDTTSPVLIDRHTFSTRILNVDAVPDKSKTRLMP